MKTKPFTGMQREKLLVALQMPDIIAALNQAMKVRRMSFILDYREDHFPRLFMEMPGLQRERIMLLDQRTHRCYISPPRQLDLLAGFTDIHERLSKLTSYLSLTGDKPRSGPRRCLLQVYVEGADKLGLTLMETTKGKRTVDTSFQLPDGTTP